MSVGAGEADGDRLASRAASATAPTGPVHEREVVIAARGLCKTYGSGELAVPVLHGVDLDIRAGERVAIIGSSGSGKSTLLHLLGGLDEASAGEVQWLSQPIASLSQTELGRRRNLLLGFVYQFHHLLPEFSALDNVAMPLRIRRLPVAQAREAAAAMLRRVGLGARLEHPPGQLSGGERQRVALARALVLEPRLLLLDEPLSNLDARLRQALREEFLRIHRLTGMTTVLVTHDLEEAFATSDRVAVMAQGSVQQFDAPETIYKRPATAFVADYLGHGNRLHGYSIPEHALRAGAAADGAGNRRAGRLLALTYLGASVRFEVEFDGVVLRGVQPPGTWLSGAVVGQPIQAGWDTDDMVPLPAGAG